jgi:hypothetical protein
VPLSDPVRHAIFWIAASAFVAAQAALLIVTLRRGARGAEPAVRPRFGRAAEVAMLLLPALGLALLLLLAWRAVGVSST